MRDIRRKIREILVKNGVKYSVRDYYKLAKNDTGSKLNYDDLSKSYGITYFIEIPSNDYYLKMNYFDRGVLQLSYGDGGGNYLFSTTLIIDDLDQKIKAAVKLVEDHLDLLVVLHKFGNGEIPKYIERSIKVDSLFEVN